MLFPDLPSDLFANPTSALELIAVELADAQSKLDTFEKVLSTNSQTLTILHKVFCWRSTVMLRLMSRR